MVNQNSFIFIACRPSGIIAILLAFCIALLLSGDASAANQVSNGDFETGDFTGWTHVAASGVDTNSAYSGTYGNYFVATNLPPFCNMQKVSNIYQSIDLTDVDELTFYYAMPVYTVYGGGASLRVFIDGSTVLWTSVSGGIIPYTYKSIDVSGYSGSHTIDFGSTAGTSSGGGGYTIRYDTIIADAIPPTININARVTHADTPLTGTIVNDENNTGGFPNENGERYLTPNEKASKEYIIDLSGNELQDGFKLEISASSADVSKLTIDISNLVASRNYDVYLDDQWIEKIGEVTEYQYDVTSFSLHTLELVHATGEEEGEGGGSGPVPPPDEDILPPDEDEIIIEDDVITIGELILTKDEFDLLTIEQIEALNVSQDTKDKLIAIKSINVDWWKIVLGLCFMAAVIEGSRKEGNEVILVCGVVGIIIAAYKLGYFQL